MAVEEAMIAGLRIAVVGTAANRTNVELVDAWCARGLDCVLVDPRAARRAAADVYLARLEVLPELDGVEPGLLEILWLERSGAVVLNRAAAEVAARDKLRTATVLTRAGLPHPPTRLLRPGTIGPAPRAPVVLKPRLGSWGRDVRLCLTDSEVSVALDEIRTRPWFRRYGVLAQAVIPSPGYDLRVLVAGGRVVGAIERHPQAGEWRTNVSLGASRRPTEPDADACSLAVAAAAAIGADLVGVDLMPLAGGGYIVIELNGAVDFTPEYCVDGDVYAEVAEALGLTARRRAATAVAVP